MSSRPSAATGTLADGEVSVTRPGSLVTPLRTIAGAEALAQRDLDEVAARARAEGYAQGLNDVAAEQDRRRGDLVEALASRLAAAADEALVYRNRLVAETVHDAIGLAIAIAESVLARELALDPEATRHALERALAIAPEGDNYLVTLPPASAIDSDGSPSTANPLWPRPVFDSRRGSETSMSPIL